MTETCPACNYQRSEHACCKCGIYAPVDSPLVAEMKATLKAHRDKICVEAVKLLEMAIRAQGCREENSRGTLTVCEKCNGQGAFEGGLHCMHCDGVGFLRTP